MTAEALKSPASSGGEVARAHEFFLASLLSTYPEDSFLEDVGVLVEDAGASGGLTGGTPWLTPLLEVARREGGLDDVRSEYLELFERGQPRTSLYETEYGRMRGMAKGNELADIAGFYQAFGMTLSDTPEGREMLDHLAVELEFYGVLLAKQAHLEAAGDTEGVSIVRDGRRKFLADHLGRLTGALARQARLRESAVYGGIVSWSCGLVEEECRALGAEPAPLELLTGEEAEEVQCGAFPPAAAGRPPAVSP
jgi:nitrate reductase assembly molybdenum cofactor insertion protein NarJ